MPILRMAMKLRPRVVAFSPALDGDGSTFKRLPSAALRLLVAVEELYEERDRWFPLQINFTKDREVADV